MEKTDNFDFLTGDIKDNRLKNHSEELEIKKQYIEKHKNDPEPDDNVKNNLKAFKTEIKNYEMRIKCIEQFNKSKTVPKIFVADKYFNEDEIEKNQESTEELYPENKEISLYETNQKGELEFVVKQRNTISTCYFMAWILGLIDKGMGNYIKENIVREYDEKHAIVRLHDEDGLPVDIIVSKTRPKGDEKRPLWLVMLDKAACVIMNRNRFEFAEAGYIAGAGRQNAKIIDNVDWYQISEDQLNKKTSPFKEGCFTKKHISWSSESVGAALVFGKYSCNESQIKKINKDCSTKLDFLRYCLQKKILIVASTNYSVCGIPKNHTVYFSKIVEKGMDPNFPDGYIEVIESYKGIRTIEFNDLNKFSLLCAINLPDVKQKNLDEDKNSDEAQLGNTKIDKSDNNLCDNKNNNLHSEINLCYNENVINNSEEGRKMQSNNISGFNFFNNQDKDVSLSTFTDWNDFNLNNQLQQLFNRLNLIIGAMKEIREQRKQINNPAQKNDTVTHIGTDDHGDIIRFMNGPVSEIVEWNENKINVVDVSDGEILFSGTQEEISSNMIVIQSRLENKYTERQNKLRDLIYNLVCPKACKFMSDYKLNFDNYNGSISFSGVEITWKNGLNGQDNPTFVFKQLIDDTLADLANNDQYNQNTIIQAIKTAMTKQMSQQIQNLDRWRDGAATNNFVNCWSLALSSVLCSDIFKTDLDLSLKKDFKVVLTHDCNIKKDLDPKKDLVRLTGDYIDRGDSSSEILCHIKNIHDKINQKAQSENNNELKKCFVTTIGNHEVSFMPDNINDMCANRLCKNLIAQSYLVPGDVIESKDGKNQNCTFSFSHTVMFKGSYPLILKQILELSELENEIRPDKINSSNNQIVVWIKNIFYDDFGNINKVGMEILKRIVNRYQKVIADTKYKDLFQKFNGNNNQIKQILNQHISDFSSDALKKLNEGIFNAGEKVYDDLKKVFNEKDYLWLKYLAMDVFCHPVVSGFDDKIKFLSNVELPEWNLLKFTFSEIGIDKQVRQFYPPCFMSVTDIAFAGTLSGRAPNNFTWEESTLENTGEIKCENQDVSQWQHKIDDVDKKYFKNKWPENIIQVHGHERRSDHSYLSQPGEVNGDITGSIGYNGANTHKNHTDYKCSLIGTAHINLNDNEKSRTEVLQYNRLTNEVKIMNDDNKQQTGELPLSTSPNHDYFKDVPSLEEGKEQLKAPGQANLYDQNKINNIDDENNDNNIINMNNNIMNINNDNNIINTNNNIININNENNIKQNIIDQSEEVDEEDNPLNTTQDMINNATIGYNRSGGNYDQIYHDDAPKIISNNLNNNPNPFYNNNSNNSYQVQQQQYGYNNMNNNDNFNQNIINTQSNIINNSSQNFYPNSYQLNINNTVNQNNNASVLVHGVNLIFRFYNVTGKNKYPVWIKIQTNQPFKDALNLLESQMKNTDATLHLDDFGFRVNNKEFGKEFGLETSVADLCLGDNTNIFCECKPEKKFTLQLNGHGINEEDNNIDNINNIDHEKQNDCIKMQFYKNVKLKDLIDDLIRDYRLNENFFWQQVKNGNLRIGNKAISSDDYEKTVSEFLSWDNNDNRTDITVNAVMQGVLLDDIKEREFALQYDNKNKYFWAVAYYPLEKLSTVIERWCHKNNFRADKFIDFMNSDKVKLIVGECALGKEVLNSPIKDINLNELKLNMKLDEANINLDDPNINLDDIKGKNFGMDFKVVDSEKELYTKNLNETQTLKEIIEMVVNNSQDKLHYNNIVDQIEKGNLKIIGKNDKECVFNKDDLEKPFYKIIGNINEFAVNGDENLPIIRFQIPTLEINQTLEINPTNNNLIKPDQINNIYINNNRSEIEYSSESQNKPKKSSWLFKLLISLAIIFAVLSVFAFALEFALALKIIFVSVAVICSIGSIVSEFVNRCKKGNPVLTDLNGYGPKISNDPSQYQNQYQYPSQDQYPGQNISQDLNNQY